VPAAATLKGSVSRSLLLDCHRLDLGAESAVQCSVPYRNVQELVPATWFSVEDVISVRSEVLFVD